MGERKGRGNANEGREITGSNPAVPIANRCLRPLEPVSNDVMREHAMPKASG